MDQFKFEELCPNNIQCKEYECTKKHPRCYAGICIEGLMKDYETCGREDCQLKHFTQDAFENEQNISPINGIYRWNLCLKKQCQQVANCRFLHPTWAKDVYCIGFLQQKCKDKQCQETHTKWTDFQKIVYNKYNIKNINPENICQKQQQCDCDKHPPNTQNICIQYFKGICNNILCTKKHVMWEEFKFNFIGLDQETLKTCIQVNSKQKLQQIQTQQDQQILIDPQSLKQLKKLVEENNIIDVIIIMDCTKTMDKWLDQIQNKISQLIDSFKKKIRGMSVRIAFVGYRDVIFDQKLQQITEKKHVVYHDFTTNVEKIKTFIKQQKAQGGGDEAEDVVAGIEKAMELNISKHPNSILVTFLFAEAPCHGKQYHDIDDDDQMESVEAGTLEKLIQRYKELKQQNFFTCVQISKKTNIMYSIMQSVFPQISISASVEPEDIPNLVGFTLQDSINKSKIREKKIQQSNKIQIEAEFSKSKYLPDRNTADKVQYWKKFQTSLSNNLRTGTTMLEISEEREIIKQGEDGVSSYVYKLFDVQHNRNMIAKLRKTLVEEYESSQKLSEATIAAAQQFASTRFYSLSIAKQMAKIYRNKTKQIEGAPPIFYTSPILYNFTQGKKFKGLDFLFAETYIDMPNIEWQKYTNNSDWVSKDHYYFSSFSHFTFIESGQTFIITDLQGKKNILSDPSFHTASEEFNQNLKCDTTNRQKLGIGEFLLNQHKECSVICQKLKLDNINGNSQLNSVVWDQHGSEEICVVCENCEEYRQITEEEYQKEFFLKCQICLEDEKETQKVQCQCCFNLFNVASNLHDKIGTITSKCQDCKVHCKSVQEQCYYCGIKCKQQTLNFYRSNKNNQIK